MTEQEKTRVIRMRCKGDGYGKIAAALGISKNTVKSFCKRNDAAGNSRTDMLAAAGGEVTCCENCGREIHQIPKQKRKRFCCDSCRNQWWNSHLDLVKRKANYHYRCPSCGKEFEVYGNSRRKYCCHACYIEDRFGGGGHE